VQQAMHCNLHDKRAKCRMVPVFLNTIQHKDWLPVYTPKGFELRAQGRTSAPWVGEQKRSFSTPKGLEHLVEGLCCNPFGVDEPGYPDHPRVR